MVKAELIHNPYLQKTTAVFNGQSPNINCELEKYETLPLSDWVSHIPSLFYNEMNGYDFDLDFVGTKHDFEIVKEAFKKCGVSEKEVRFFLKNELETPDVKSKGIDDLFEWLKNNRNKRFDYEKFMQDYSSVFAYSCSYILVRLNTKVDIDYHVNIEEVSKISELESTVVSHTPILFYLEEETMGLFRDELVSILNRNDVKENQLFFLLHPSLNEERVLRVIHDLGVDNPQRVSSVNDEKILKYLRNYPIAEYVREVINILEDNIQMVQQKYDEDNASFQSKNKEIHSQLEILDNYLDGLHESKLYYSDINEYRLNDGVNQCKMDLLNMIEVWRKRTTKIKGENECYNAAQACNNDFYQYVDRYVNKINQLCEYEKDQINNELYEVYKKIGLDENFSITNVSLFKPNYPMIPNVTNDLINLKQIVMEVPTGGFFDLFKKTTNEVKEAEPVTVCYLEQWRNLLVEKATEIIDAFILSWQQQLKQYRDDSSNCYLEKVEELLVKINDKKNDIMSKLSDEDKIMQVDNQWLNEIRYKLNALERS